MSWTSPLKRVLVFFLLALPVAAILLGRAAETAAAAAVIAVIVVHEAGHFAAARAVGVAADRFFVGFGPTLWSAQRGGVEYGVKAIPLGGFVRVAGMSSIDRDRPDGYGRAPWWKKAVIVAAGPGANMMLAVAMLAVAYSPLVGEPRPTLVVDVSVGSPAHAAGLRTGDRISRVEGSPVGTWEEVYRAAVDGADDGALAVTVDRGGESLTRVVRLRAPGDVRIGVAPKVERVSDGWAAAARTALLDTASSVSAVARASAAFAAQVDVLVGSVLRGDPVPEEARPVSIIGAVALGADAGRTSVFDALWLGALFNVYLAFFNLLPLPPLDGGHLAVSTAEAGGRVLLRREVRIPEGVTKGVATAVSSALILLGAIAVYLDVAQPLSL